MSIRVFFFSVAKNSGDRSVQANRSVKSVWSVSLARAGDDRADRRDEKSCRWVQIDDVNGPPASRGGGWLVEVKCECVFMVEERRIEMRRNGGENKNTIRMYILPRFTRFFLYLSTVCSCYRLSERYPRRLISVNVRNETLRMDSVISNVIFLYP